jgi:hypothetical protein
MDDDTRWRDIEFINGCERINRVLHGLGCVMQRGILANVTSMWLAGHFLSDDSGDIDRVATNEMREALLQEFINLVRELIPLSEQELLERIAEEKKDA